MLIVWAPIEHCRASYCSSTMAVIVVKEVSLLLTGVRSRHILSLTVVSKVHGKFGPRMVGIRCCNSDMTILLVILVKALMKTVFVYDILKLSVHRALTVVHSLRARVLRATTI